MKEVMCMKDGPLTAGAPDPEVPEKATRRKFSAEYKLRILKLADNCTDSGSLGRLLRREGLYSSNLTTWRRQRDSGMLQGLEPPSGDVKPSNAILCGPSSTSCARKMSA